MVIRGGFTNRKEEKCRAREIGKDIPKLNAEFQRLARHMPTPFKAPLDILVLPFKLFISFLFSSTSVTFFPSVLIALMEERIWGGLSSSFLLTSSGHLSFDAVRRLEKSVDEYNRNIMWATYISLNLYCYVLKVKRNVDKIILFFIDV